MNFKPIATAALAVSLGVTIALTGCATDSGTTPGGENGDTSDSVTQITISAMANVVPTRTAIAGVDQGFFTDEGLDATVSEVPNPPVALAALQGGTADFAYAPLSTALTVIANGIDIQMIAPADGLPDTGDPADFTKWDDTAIYINPSSGITSPGQLAGKTVAVPSRNGIMEIIIAWAVKADGGDPAAIEWIVLDQQSQLTALSEKRIDAAGIATPFTNMADEDGLELLVHPRPEFFEHGANGVWITMRDTATEKPELIEAFARAAVASNDWINTNIADVTKDWAAQQNLTYDPADLVFGHLATSLKLEDVERAAGRMVELGYLEKSMDLTDYVIEVK